MTAIWRERHFCFAVPSLCLLFEIQESLLGGFHSVSSLTQRPGLTSFQIVGFRYNVSNYLGLHQGRLHQAEISNIAPADGEAQPKLFVEVTQQQLFLLDLEALRWNGHVASSRKPPPVLFLQAGLFAASQTLGLEGRVVKRKLTEGFLKGGGRRRRRFILGREKPSFQPCWDGGAEPSNPGGARGSVPHLESIDEAVIKLSISA